MGRGNKLAKNTLVYSIGGLAPSILSYALLPLYTAFLSTADYGNFDILMVTVSLLVPFISMDIPAAVYRYSITEDQKTRSEIFSTATGVILRNLLLFDCIAVPLILAFSIKYSWLFLILANISIISGLLIQAMRSTGKLLELSGLQILSAIVMLALNIYLMVFVGLKVEALMISNIAGLAIICLIGACYLKVWDLFAASSISKSLRKSMIKYSWPLILSTVSWWVMISSDRYIVTYYLGLGSTGIYSIANKLPSLLVMLYLNFGYSWQDSAISYYQQKGSHDFYTRTFDHVMTIALSAGLVFIASGKYILDVFVHEKFYEAWMYVPLLFLGSVFCIFSYFYSVGFHCAKKTRASFYTAGTGAVTNILGNLLFVPVWGLQGAAFSTCLSFFVMWVLRIYLVKDILNIKINWNKFLSLFVLMGITIVYYYRLKNDYEQLLLFLGAIIIFLAYNRSLIGSLLLPGKSTVVLKKIFGKR
jgi:O-antigen/teichoic acid export membrane protein